VDGVKVDILEGGSAHDSYGVLVIQSPTNGSSSLNCDTAVAAADRGARVTSDALRPTVTNDDGRRWLGRAYRKQMSTWDSVLSKTIFRRLLLSPLYCNQCVCMHVR